MEFEFSDEEPEGVEVSKAKRELSEEEKEICDSVGIENPDYCVAAILNNRYSEKDVVYHEDQRIFEVDEEKMEIEFEIVRESSSIVLEENEDLEGEYDWIAEMLVTIEILFDLK